MITLPIASSLIRTMAPDIVEIPVPKPDAWFKITLGNIITLVVMVGGFFLSYQANQDKLGNVQSDVTDLKASFKAVELSQNTTTLTLRDITAKQIESDKSFEYVNKRFEQHDNRLGALEGQISTLNTNLQLVNQQLQYIGTSHLVQPSIKK